MFDNLHTAYRLYTIQYRVLCRLFNWFNEYKYEVRSVKQHFVQRRCALLCRSTKKLSLPRSDGFTADDVVCCCCLHHRSFTVAHCCWCCPAVASCCDCCFCHQKSLPESLGMNGVHVLPRNKIRNGNPRNISAGFFSSHGQKSWDFVTSTYWAQTEETKPP